MAAILCFLNGFREQEGEGYGGRRVQRGLLGGKFCRVSRQLLTVAWSLRTNEEHIGCLLLFAPRLSASIGGELSFVEAGNDLQVLSRLPLFSQLPFALPAQALDKLGDQLDSPEARGRTYNLKSNFGSRHTEL
jgi:hypothetical protein